MKQLISLTFISSLFFLLSVGTTQAQLIADVQSIQEAPLHAGVARTFNHSFNEVVKAARESMVESGLVMESVSKVDEDTYMLIGKAKTGGFSWGELVRVVVVKTGSNESKVNVLSKRRVKINVTAKSDYSNTILSNMDLKLNL